MKKRKSSGKKIKWRSSPTETVAGLIGLAAGENCAPLTGYAPWKPPFHYYEMGQWIADSEGHRILDMRGWGFLTGRGHAAKAMDEDEAANLQDAVGTRVCELLNKDAQAHNGADERPAPARKD